MNIDNLPVDATLHADPQQLSNAKMLFGIKEAGKSVIDFVKEYTPLALIIYFAESPQVDSLIGKFIPQAQNNRVIKAIVLTLLFAAVRTVITKLNKK